MGREISRALEIRVRPGGSNLVLSRQHRQTAAVASQHSESDCRRPGGPASELATRTVGRLGQGGRIGHAFQIWPSAPNARPRPENVTTDATDVTAFARLGDPARALACARACGRRRRRPAPCPSHPLGSRHSEVQVHLVTPPLAPPGIRDSDISGRCPGKGRGRGLGPVQVFGFRVSGAQSGPLGPWAAASSGKRPRAFRVIEGCSIIHWK